MLNEKKTLKDLKERVMEWIKSKGTKRQSIKWEEKKREKAKECSNKVENI